MRVICSTVSRQLLARVAGVAMLAVGLGLQVKNCSGPTGERMATSCLNAFFGIRAGTPTSEVKKRLMGARIPGLPVDHMNFLGKDIYTCGIFYVIVSSYRDPMMGSDAVYEPQWRFLKWSVR